MIIERTKTDDRLANYSDIYNLWCAEKERADILEKEVATLRVVLSDFNRLKIENDILKQLLKEENNGRN